ncbi:MAG: 23S rRNA (adenine(2030)-N(6))-methyltransferase RlmJ [Steroidobacteraceae bacterium]
MHKHVALCALLQALTRKDKGLFYLDTHAGRGAYDLASSAEGRASAAAIERVIAASRPHPELAAYAHTVASWRAHTGRPDAYPGSPVIAAMQLRRQDRAELIELLPDEASALERAVSAWPRARVETGDGFERLKAFLPPRERRGLTLLDPPYEQTREDHARIGTAIVEALGRFATGILALWYPIKDVRDTGAWLATLRPRIGRETLTSELWVHPCDSRVALNGSGLLIINPPYGVAERMRVWLPELHALLDPAGAGGCRLVPMESPP